jgi:hypothetical protein
MYLKYKKKKKIFFLILLYSEKELSFNLDRMYINLNFLNNYGIKLHIKNTKCHSNRFFLGKNLDTESFLKKKIKLYSGIFYFFSLWLLNS